MAFKKGQSGNPNGRPRGAKNKATNELREWVERLINDNLDTITNDIKELDPNERVKFFLALLNYTLPKQQSVKAEINDEREQIVIANLSAESRETLEKIKRGGLNGLVS